MVHFLAKRLGEGPSWRFRALALPPDAPVDRQKWPGQGYGHTPLPLVPVLEQLFKIVGHGREQHGFVGARVAPRVYSPQVVVVN